MPSLQAQFNRTSMPLWGKGPAWRPPRPALVGLAILTFAPAAWAGPCPGSRAVRLGLIGGTYGLAEATALVLRHDDWWSTPRRAFYVVWDPSASSGQDRLLHASIAYHASQAGAAAFDWACVSHTAAGWLGAALGVAIALPKEIGDGLHESKGFSGPDMAWTAAGALLPAVHRAVPVSRAVSLKVQYWPSDEFRHRTGSQPELESDYAGQRYFLALAPVELGRTTLWPPWLGLAVGHSVAHWISAPPVAEWYVTFDLHARGLPVTGRLWRPVSWVLDQVHLPAPGVRLRGGEIALGLF